MAQSQRQVAAALCRMAFPRASDAGSNQDSTLAAFTVTDSSGPRLAALLLQLRTQVPSAPLAVSSDRSTVLCPASEAVLPLCLHRVGSRRNVLENYKAI